MDGIADTMPARPFRANRRFAPLHWLLAGAIVLPLLVAAAGAWLAWRNVWRAAEAELSRTTDTAAEYARRLLDGHRAAADRVNDLLRGLPDAEIRAREHQLHAALRAMVPNLPQVQTAYVTDRHGALLLSASVHPVPPVDMSDREYHSLYQRPDPPETVVTRAYRGRVEPHLFFAVSRPRRNTGNGLPPDMFDGQANVSINPGEVSAGLRRLLAQPHDSLSLFRADGHILARHPAFAEPLPSLGGDGPILQSVARADRGVLLAPSPMGGQMRLIAFRAIDGWSGQHVGTGRDRAEILAVWRREAATHLAFALPAMLALGALAMLVQRGQARLAEANTLLELRVADRTAALARSEARLRLATEAAGIGVWETDLRTRHGHRSDQARAMMGASTTDYTWDDSLALVHPDDRDAAVSALERAMASGTYEAVFRTARPAPDGGPRWLMARGRVETDAAGIPLRSAGVLVDITAERRADAARHDSEARFRAFQDVSPVGFAIHRALRDEAGQVVDLEVEYANPAAHRIVGAPPGSLVGGRLLRQLPEAREAPLLFPRYLRILAGEEPGGEVEIEMHGPRFHGWFRNAVVRLDTDRLALSLQDMTSEHQARDTLARSHAELEALVEARTAALLRAADEKRRAEEMARQSEKLAALGQLVGGVAHDFNNLLQVIGSGAALLRRPGLTDARRAAVLEGMERAGDTARELTGRLLAFARQQPLSPETFSLNARLLGMSALLRQTLGSTVRVETDLAPDLWPVHADPGQLELAVLNLAVNARDAMPEGGRLVLSTRNETLPAGPDHFAGDYVRLDVRDTGIGMAPAVLARALEPFFTTKEPGRGTGLGLPQVFGFARQSGGDLHVESTQGAGTTVTIVLPRAAGTPDGGAATAAGALRMPKFKAVLVVEDNEAAGEFAASLLEELGYRARTATSATQAIELLRAGEEVDAVFSDVVLPGGMNGNELAVAIACQFPQIAVVLATGYGGQAAATSPPPGVETLPKPYQLTELAAALERALSRVERPRLAPA